ncbi:hypothetical protein GpartN1_g2822.t1 [Galdieria partita]|uniref:Uncharacterized protein n=1 Tax=Galdieria partita TaxID=83374 RepID=A0A9C7PV88_9RHOD|nr:hypothetical protein GpartN1_g2328.t1 [Galdieria partita]GJQ11031.1 hypothetical protein GpartN1_g2822.t1 [Galdieria partita]
MSIVWILHGLDLSNLLLKGQYENLDSIAEKGCSGICALYECSEFLSVTPELSVKDSCFLQVSGLSRWNRFQHKERFPSDTIYGLRTAVLTTDESLWKHRNQVSPFNLFLLTEIEEDSLTQQLWYNCCQLLCLPYATQTETTASHDLVLIYLKNIPNQVILNVANVVTGKLLSIPNEIPFLGVLGFDPRWKKTFEDLLPFRNDSVSFLPRQSFQSIDELILERHCFEHNTHLWASFYKEGFTRRDKCYRFLPEECFSLGCNRVILAEHLIYEIAFLQETVPKYGS